MRLTNTLYNFVFSKSIAYLALFVAILLTYGCQNTELRLAKSKHQIEETKIVFDKDTPIYINVHKKGGKKLKKKISISASGISLMSAITYIDSSFSISPDSGVDLNQLLDIKFNNKTIEEYLDYLSELSNYHIELISGVIKINSFQEKTWSLQTISMEQVTVDAEGGGAGDGSSNWSEIVANLGSVLGDKATILDNKQLGTITAIAPPDRIRQADKWMSEIINSSNRQIHLSVKLIDVTVDEGVGQGVDWSLLSDASSKFKISNRTTQTVDGAGIISIGTPSGTTVNLGKKLSLNVMLNLLRKQGKVKLENQPNVTVTNGRTAFIVTGDEFSYIGSTKVTVTTTGSVYTSTVVRTDVGVKMQVTPKILDNGRIVVSIVPVISSLKSFTELKNGNHSTIRTPNIALQSLATQVIVDSGETIHLGGLIAEKIANSIKTLPESSGILSLLFNGEQNTLERREIVILITPTII